MSRTEDTTGNEKNIGGIGRNRGPRAGSDLSGGVTRVEREKGLETAPRASRIVESLKATFGRLGGDPIPMIDGSENGLVLLDNPSRPSIRVTHEEAQDFTPTPEGTRYGKTAKELRVDLDEALGQPDHVLVNGERYVREEPVDYSETVEVNGQRYVHEERVEESKAREDRYSADNQALRDELAAERAKVAELSKVRVFNVAGLVEKDLAERYESLAESFAALQADMIERNHDLAEARALIAESAPVVAFVQRLANAKANGGGGFLVDGMTAPDWQYDAQQTFKSPADYDPRTYTDEQSQKAAQVLRNRISGIAWRDSPIRLIDEVAAALGMRRAK